MYEYCNACGWLLDYVDSEWAKYNFSDSEEIISIYECSNCKRKYNKREGNFELELREFD